MRVRVRTVLVSVLGLMVLAFLGLITAVGWQVVLGPHARAVTSRKIEATPARLARGKYLVEGPAHCFHCHSEHDFSDPEASIIQAKKGAGWVIPIPELGTIAAPNITSDPDTGLGNWTDDEILRAMQEGVDKNGTALFPVMPYQDFAKMTDEDIASVVVYIRTVPPVKNRVPERKLVFPLNFIVNTIPEPITSHPAPPARTSPEARGEYLVRAVAGCAGCHTPTDDQGKPLPGLEFGGGAVFHDPAQNGKEVFSVNITQDPSGIAHYDEDLFVQTLHTGQIPGRMLNHIMPFEFFRNITDDDLRDIWAYMKSVPPVKHRISNTDPPTKCIICNQTHGLGELNVKK
jgi:hypothetical protein